MQKLHLKNFRKSLNSEIGLADFTMLIGKNNSGKSNVAKSLLLLSDYLESDSIIDFPLNGQNSIYHNILAWKELQSWQSIEEYNPQKEGSSVEPDKLPQIRVTLSGGAILSITLKEYESIYPRPIIVEKIEIIDSDNLPLFKVINTDYSYSQVYYSLEGIQHFLFLNNIKVYDKGGNQLIKNSGLTIFKTELNNKIALLNNCSNQAERARIQTEISNLRSKIERISSHEVTIKNPDCLSFEIKTQNSDYSKRTVLELLSSFIPLKWSRYCAQQNMAQNYDSDSKWFTEKPKDIDFDEESEITQVSDQNIENYETFRELTLKFSKFIFSQLSQVCFSPVNRYTPYREFIDTQTFSQRNNVDLIRDVSKLLWNNIQIDLRGDEESFLNKWLVEFGISTNHRNEEGMLLQIRKESNLGFSIFVFDDNVFTTKGMYGYVNLADKGYGSGQILAILLKIIVSSRSANNQRKFKTVNSILVLEEPESNLHPDFQAKLIDMLWDAQQKFNIRFIIECHSEYMIRRLQVLVKNKDLKPDQISIAYFNEAEINQIRISDNGFLDKQIPTGFMDIAAQMAIEIL